MSTSRSSANQPGNTEISKPSLVPVLIQERDAHNTFYQRLQRVLALSHSVTIVCGAGVSTSAGIPVRTYTRNTSHNSANTLQDFRSTDGLYNSPALELGNGSTMPTSDRWVSLKRMGSSAREGCMQKRPLSHKGQPESSLNHMETALQSSVIAQPGGETCRGKVIKVFYCDIYSQRDLANARYTAAPLAAGFQLGSEQAGKRHVVKPGLG
jgi:hypothetical protein